MGNGQETNSLANSCTLGNRVDIALLGRLRPIADEERHAVSYNRNLVSPYLSKNGDESFGTCCYLGSKVKAAITFLLIVSHRNFKSVSTAAFYPARHASHGTNST